MIQTFPNTAEGEAAAFAVAEPREIASLVIGGQRTWIVRTGDDLQAQAPVLSVKNWQMRRALNAQGLRAEVDAVIAQATQDMKDMWDYSPDVDRAHPFVEQMRLALQLTQQQVDELFTLADSIKN